MPQNEKHLVWLDLEMTGLKPDEDRIMEIATVITDSNLNVVAEGPAYIIHQPDELLNTMDKWCTDQHGKSGLTERVRKSSITEKEAEDGTLHFIQQWVPREISPLCGNTIYQDRRFLVKYMPTLESYFHYRNLDVSTLKILAQRWAPEIASGFTKESLHLALSDVYHSINELKYYREQFNL